ncbi:YrhB domain-containing protein [Sphingobium sp. Leaf26]|uniref:YrhB domain-containing protein n=1 Tax=Sphingobium sp. Leaf26 TaxID=1735693 RepID=UPI0009EA38D3
MDERSATDAFDRFLRVKQAALGEALARVPHEARRLSAGWAFFYQSEAFVATGDVGAMLVGQGPVVIHDDGRVVEGGSLDRDPEVLLHR